MMMTTTFTVWPERLDSPAALASNWSIYVVRFPLVPALKIGMVGTGTIAQRLAHHTRTYGPCELLRAWSLAHSASQLEEPRARSLVEQYEARLQFAAEIAEPDARLRRLRPDAAFSLEWFEDDPRVLTAVDQIAPLPITLPHGWTLQAGEPDAVLKSPNAASTRSCAS
jgi:hypothetical protein